MILPKFLKNCIKLRKFWAVDPPLKNDIGIGSWATSLYFPGVSSGGSRISQRGLR